MHLVATDFAVRTLPRGSIHSCRFRQRRSHSRRGSGAALDLRRLSCVSAVSAQISPSAPEGVFPNKRALANVTTVNVDESKVCPRRAEELGFQVVKDRYLPRRPHGATVGHSFRGIFVRSSHRRRSPTDRTKKPPKHRHRRSPGEAGRRSRHKQHKSKPDIPQTTQRKYSQ